MVMVKADCMIGPYEKLTYLIGYYSEVFQLELVHF